LFVGVEVDPLFEVAGGHAELYFRGGPAQRQPTGVKLIMDYDFPQTPSVEEGYPGKVHDKTNRDDSETASSKVCRSSVWVMSSSPASLMQTCP
jgi:hypothetical protein